MRVTNGGNTPWWLVATGAGIILLVVALLLSRRGEAPIPDEVHSTLLSVDASPVTITRAPVAVASTPTRTPRPSSSAASSTIAGRAIFADTGEPVVGAVVSFLDSSALDVSGFTLSAFGTAGLKATTDNEGRFSVVSEELSHDDAMKLIRLDTTDGGAVLFSSLNIQDRAGDGLILRVPDLETVTGTVVNSAGAPLGSVTVRPTLSARTPSPASPARAVAYPALTPFTTSEDGRFTFKTFLNKQPMEIIAIRAGYRRALFPEASDGDDIRITMEPGGATVKAVAKKVDGSPAVGVRIGLGRMVDVGPMTMSVSPDPGDFGITDENGEFEFHNLYAGSWSVGVFPGDRGYAIRSFEKTFTIRDDSPITVELTVPDPLKVTLRFLESPSEQPVPGVGVSNMNAPSTRSTRWTEFIPEAYSDGNGVVSLALTPMMVGNRSMANVRLAIPMGYAQVTPSHGTISSLNITWTGERSEHEETVMLQKGHVLALTVLRPDAETPVPSETLVSMTRADTRAMVQLMTDASGRVVTTLLYEHAYSLQVRSDEGWLMESLTMPTTGAPAEKTLVLRPFMTLAGRVVDSDGNAVEGARIATSPIADRPESWFIMNRATTQSESVVSGSDGSFKVAHIMGDSFSLQAIPPSNSGLLESERQTLQAVASGLIEGIELIVSAGGSITVKVVDHQGQPIEGAAASWSTLTTQTTMNMRTLTQATAVSNAKGEFKIMGLSEDSLITGMRIAKEGYIQAYRNEARFLEGDFQITLRPIGGVTLTVIDEVSGRPIPDYDYLVYLSAWDQWSYARAPSRVQSPEGVTPLTIDSPGGKRVVVAERGSYGVYTGRKGAATFTVAQDGTMRDVVVPIGQTASIRGEVLRDEKPVEGATVFQLMRNRGITVPSIFTTPDVVTDSRGRFVLEDLVEGTYELLARDETSQTDTAVVVEIGRDRQDVRDVVIQMAGAVKGTILEGRVTLRDGRPAAQANLFTWFNNESHNIFADGQGRFRFELRGGGQATVSVSTQGMNLSRTAELVEGEINTLDVDFRQTIEVSGRIQMNGRPWVSMTKVQFGFAPRGGVGGWAALQATGNGRYTANVFPGEYSLRLIDGMASPFVSAPFTVAAEPNRQTRDFEVVTASADVAIEFPEGHEPQTGWLRFVQRMADGSEEDDINSQIEGARRRIEYIMPGTYRVAYQSYQRPRMEAESEWVTVTPDGTNVFVLFAKPAEESDNPVARVQRRLTELGYDPGPVDGLMGPMTRNAIRAYQADQELPVTGEPDEATVGRLNPGSQ